MDKDLTAPPSNPGRFRKAFVGSLVVAGLLSWVFAFQSAGSWWEPFAARPGNLGNLLTGWGYAFFHANAQHLLSNGMAVVLLGTLAYGLYPRALKRTVPLSLLLSYAAIWLLGTPGTLHVGTSGITYGLMAMVGTMGLLRKDRPARGAGLVVWFFFGGAWWATLPGFPGISWEGHLGGSIAGVLAAIRWRRLDPSIEPPSPLEGEDEDTGAGMWDMGQGSPGIVPPPPCPPATQPWQGDGARPSMREVTEQEEELNPEQLPGR